MDWDALARERDREARRERPRALPANTGISSSRRRLAAYLLDAVLSVLTLGIGWLIWSLFAWKRSQSPGKQLLDMYVVHDGQRATWRRMAARELLAKGLVGLVCGLLAAPSFGLSLLPYFCWLLFDPMQQQLWDKVTKTYVREERW